MNEIIKKDLIAVLSDLLDILKSKEEKDIFEIRNLSNHTIHNASIFQDEDSVSIAVLIYSLSKIIERKYRSFNYSSVMPQLRGAIIYLKKGNIDSYRNTIKNIFKLISTIDTKLKLYIEDVIKQAEIKKGSRLYEHGISMARAADILGISEWELMFYTGKTRIADMPLEPVNVVERLKLARRLFS